MRWYLKIAIVISVLIVSCAIVSGGILFYANILHQFNWSYDMIFITFFSFIALMVIGGLIFIMPWDKEYDIKLAEGLSEEVSFNEACKIATRCPPKWFLQPFRKKKT